MVHEYRGGAGESAERPGHPLERYRDRVTILDRPDPDAGDMTEADEDGLERPGHFPVPGKHGAGHLDTVPGVDVCEAPAVSQGGLWVVQEGCGTGARISRCPSGAKPQACVTIQPTS